MSCSFNSTILAIFKNYLNFEFNRYIISYIIIFLTSTLIGYYIPFIQLLLTVLTFIKIDKYKLFINIYFPESYIISVNTSHIDEMSYAKFPMLIVFFINAIRCAKSIKKELTRTKIPENYQELSNQKKNE